MGAQAGPARDRVKAAGPPGAGPDGAHGRLRIAMALYGDVTYDSRVMREAETLTRAGHEVTIYCLGGTLPSDAPFRVIAQAPSGAAVLPDGSSPFLRRPHGSVVSRAVDRVRWAVGYARTVRAWGHAAVRTAGDVDVWHAHDLTGLLAVGPLVRPPCRLVYDSHEIFLETGSAERLPGPVRRLLGVYEGRLARRAFALVTVNEGYADVLRQRLRPARTIVVRNCPPRWDPPDDAALRLRTAASVPSGMLLVLYHGVFEGGRGIEELAEAMLAPGLETAHLALLGYGSDRPALERLAREERFRGRIHVLDAVPPTELLAWVAGADVDVIPLQPANLNLWLCSPNKLWESLAAGVPVVVSDFPVMRRVVLDDPAGPLGGVCEPASSASIGAAIRAIVDLPESDRDILRRRCLAAAHESWNWEGESAHLVELYEQLSVCR